MSFGSRKPAAAPRRSVPAPAPAAKPPAPMQQSSGGGMLSGIGSTIAQGMAFGTGSAIAHRAVGAVAGSMSGGEEAAPAPVDQYQQTEFAAPQMCSSDKQMFYECLQMNKGDQESCRFLYDALKDCQLNSRHASM